MKIIKSSEKMFSRFNMPHLPLVVCLTLLVISSAVIALPGLNPKAANAQVTTISTDLLQYEWTESAASPSRTFFSAGPAPSAPNILWKADIPGVTGTGNIPVAFNGLVFVQDLANTYALDGGTGAIVWTAAGITGNMAKIDDTYMVIGSTCVTIDDGKTVWTGPPGFSLDQTVVDGSGYVPELKMFIDYNCGWNLPDPSKPPTVAWNLTSQQDVGHGYTVYGEGCLFIGAEDGYLRAYNASTGTLIWKTPITSAWEYGASYYNGMVIHGGLDDNMQAYNATNGQLIWTYNPRSWYGMWASASGVAYGMVYEHNQDNYVYAINATTGQLVWRASGPGMAYSNILAIADGKVYVQMGENQYRDFNTGEYGHSEYDCFDAYTGALMWSLPMEDCAPFNLQCIAYGNLYLCPTVSTGNPGLFTYPMFGVGSIGQVWCIGSQVKDWSMFMSDPKHTAEGAGPTNLTLKWKFQTDGEVVSSPSISNGVCYFGSLDDNIYAVDANTGAKMWNFSTGYEVKSSVAVVNGKVFTGADDGNIYCLDATTGAKIWETYAGGVTTNLLGSGTYITIEPPTRSSPIVVGNDVFVGSLDGNVYCLDADGGSVLWKFQTGGPILASVTVADSALYCVSCTPGINGQAYKLDAATGKVLWGLTIPYVLNRTYGFGNFIFASPTVAHGMVFIRNGLFYNYGVNATTGNIVWTTTARFDAGTSYQIGGVLQINAPLYSDGFLYMNDYYGISCLNATNGAEVWYTYLSRENISPSLAYAYGRIYTVNELGNIYVLNSLTGEKISYYSVGSYQMHSTPSLYNGSLYVGCNDWNVYCFGDAAQPVTQTTANTQPTVTSQPASNPTVTPYTASTATPQPSSTSSTNTTNSSTTYIVIAAVAIVIVIVAIAAVALTKRKKKT